MKSFCSKKSFLQISFVFEDDAVIFFHMQCCEKVSSLRRVLLFMPSTFLRYPESTQKSVSNSDLGQATAF